MLTHGRVPGRRLAAALVLALSLLAACGFGERKDQAKRIVGSPALVHAKRTARAVITSRVRIKLPESIDREEERLVPPGPFGRQDQVVEASHVASIDFVNDRSAIFLEATPEAPVAIFDRLSVYLRRTGRGAERRPWEFLDFEKLEPSDVRTTANPPVGFLPISPQLMVQFVGGTLSGSITKEAENVDVGGVPTTRYAVTYDWEKVLREPDREYAGLPELDDDHAEGLQRVYESMQIADGIFPGELWLDADGIVRRFTFVLEQRYRVESAGNRGRRARIENAVTVELGGFGEPAAIPIPERNQTIAADSFAQLVREARQSVDVARVAQGQDATTPRGDA